jgi:hypothetical protein
LLSDQDGRFSLDSTGDWRARWQKHNSGAVRSRPGEESPRKEVGTLTTLADENVA